MPWKYKDLDEHGVLEVTVEGLVGIDELKQLTLDNISNVIRTKYCRILIDYSRATINVNLIDLFELPKFYDEQKARRAGYKNAAVITDEQLFRKFADFFENITSNRGFYGFKFFQTYEDAYKWLIEE